MKKSILACAVAGAIAGAPAVHAQEGSSIQIYGVADGGVAVTNSGAPGAHDLAQVVSGTQVGSYLGFRGFEDLGGGTKAFFRLDAGFSLDTGAAKSYSGNPGSATAAAPAGTTVTGLFNKRALVGLEGRYGSFGVGRDYTTLYWAGLDIDPMRYGLYGNLQESVLISGTGAERYGQVSNAVGYASPNFRGAVFRIMYSAGSESAGIVGTPTPASAPPKNGNRLVSASLTYAGNGLNLAAAWQRFDLPLVAGSGATAVFTGANGTRIDLLLGAKYRYKGYALGTGWIRIRQPLVNTDARDFWLGGSADVGSGTLLTEMQKLRQDAPAGGAKRATVFGLAYVYPLSKRSNLYGTYGRTGNNAVAQFGLASGDGAVAAGAAGARVTAFALGIRHQF